MNNSVEEIAARDQRCPIATGELAYSDAGSGAPIVFLHGATLSGRMWAPHEMRTRWGSTPRTSSGLMSAGLHELLTRLAAVDKPVLVLTGSRDPVRRSAARGARLIPDSSLVTIPGAGHLTNRDCPELVNAHLDRWLDGVAHADSSSTNDGNPNGADR